MDTTLYSVYADILREELVPAMGCTEPIAVAYAGALARETLGTEPSRIELTVSGNIIKNVKSVIVPHTGGRKGLSVAVAAGACIGDAGAQLEVLANVTPAQLAGFKALYMDGTQFRPIDRRIQGDMVLMHFPGWDDMTAAETLKTKILSIKRSEVQLKKGEFLDAELIGMQVYEDFIHRYVGTVEEVLTYPAHKLYKVRGPEKCYLIPAVQDIFIVDIDAEKREIYVKMIEGLETNAD